MGLWNCLHISMACVYTIFGLIQVIAGLFFLTSMRMIKLCGNVWVGTLDILIGISSGTLACSCEISTTRQKVLLCMSVSILLINTVNTIISEWFFLTSSVFSDIFTSNRYGSYGTVVRYARLLTELGGLGLIILSFIDIQLIFVSYLSLRKRNHQRFLNKQSTVITPQATPTHTNWVFQSPTTKKDETTSTSSPETPQKHKPIYEEPKLLESAMSTTENYLSNSHLSTFSRTPSPKPGAKCEFVKSAARPIEFIEKRRKENDPYSNLLIELEKAFKNRKDSATIIGPEELAATTSSNESLVLSTTSSKSSKNSSDRKFSKELEAALQSIQDLESPHNEVGDYDEFGSKTSVNRLDSQTTSGYSSPTQQKNGKLPNNKSPQNLKYSITTNETNNATVISLHSKPPSPKQFKTVTEIKCEHVPDGDSSGREARAKSNESFSSKNSQNEDKNGSEGKRSLLKSFLHKKRKPIILPELEDAILKSESLAFLSDEELLQRLEQNSAVRRQEALESESRLRSLGFLPESIFFIKLWTPEELTRIEEIGRIKGCSKVFEVISKYPKNIQGLLRDISSLSVTQKIQQKVQQQLGHSVSDSTC